MNRLITAIAVGLLAAPVFASGDIDKGAKGFKKCKSCHTIAPAEGDPIVKGGKTGPNLYGVMGRTAGTYEGFKYGADLVAAGEAGLVWDEENFLAYVQNPKEFLKEYLDNTSAKSKMSFKLRKGGEDVAAYLASVAE